MGRKDVNKPVRVILFLAVLAVAGWFAYTNFMKPLDVEADLKMSESQLAAKHKSTFTDNPKMAGKVPQYTEPEKTTITVRSDGTFDVIYANGVQIGVGTANTHATAYNVKWGDGDETAIRNLTFKHDTPFEVLNDMAEGSSTASFYPNEANNTCFVWVRNDTTGRIIYIAYYTDLKKVSEALSF